MTSSKICAVMLAVYCIRCINGNDLLWCLILEIKFAIFLSNWIDGTESENNPLLEVLLENIYLSKYLVVCLGLLWWRNGAWPLSRLEAAQESFQNTQMDTFPADVPLPSNRKHHNQDIWEEWKWLCVASWWYSLSFDFVKYDRRVSETYLNSTLF